jgi:hypothetical protein
MYITTNTIIAGKERERETKTEKKKEKSYVQNSIWKGSRADILTSP